MQRLFEDFTPVSREEWEAQALKDLRGKTLQDLTSTTRDGIEIKPFYTETSAKAQPNKAKTGWDIVQEIVVENEAEANAQALEALQRGANGLLFYINPVVKGIACDFHRISFIGFWSTKARGAKVLNQ